MPLANPYIKRIPFDVKPRAIGLYLDIPVGDAYTTYPITTATQAIRLSLKTSDGRERKARALKVDAFLETVWNALRRNELVPQALPNCVLLAKAMYVSWAGSREVRTDSITLDQTARQPDGSYPVMDMQLAMPPDTEPPEVWQAMVDKLDGQLVALAEGELDALVQQNLDRVISKELLKLRGVMGTDQDTMRILRREFLRAMRDGFAKRALTADGDFTPDPKADRFPKQWQEDGKVRAPMPASGVRITSLVDDWWKEAEKSGRSKATYDGYKMTLKHLAAFVGHDDAARVTASDVVAFKDKRLASGSSVATIRLNLAALKSVFGWAADNGKLATNPALSTKVMSRKAPKLREKDFTLEEATAILAHANKQTGSGHRDLARYWVPWLCAYTGARVGEMVQLRKVDITQDEDTKAWVMCITPEAGTVKDKEVRYVVIHEHLIARGFLTMVEECKTPYLFLPLTNKSLETLMRSIKGMLGAFAREVVKDPNVAPNHGWRHSFKTRGRGVGIQDSVLDSITGHAPQTVGGRYGSVELATQAEAMRRFPRY